LGKGAGVTLSIYVAGGNFFSFKRRSPFGVSLCFKGIVVMMNFPIFSLHKINHSGSVDDNSFGNSGHKMSISSNEITGANVQK